MNTKTIDKKLWNRLGKCGNVSYSGKTILAKPHFDGRSEVKLKQEAAVETQNYKYSFRLTGNQSEKTTIILQFHDWWSIPEHIKVGNKSILYLATPPPLAFAIRNQQLILSHNELLSHPRLDMENEWLVVEQHRFTHHELFAVQLNEWIDLDITINWSLDHEGFVKCNDVEVANLKTMFNSNPCHIQFGLYLDTSFESNEIREFRL